MSTIVMGVSGCGKTMVGVLLAERLGQRFYDADDFHSSENKAKMHRGVPLTDEDRLPWLGALRDLLQASEHEGREIVLACSALRRQFRHDLVSGIPGVRFVYLRGDRALIAERLARRKDHFMPPGLLDSQFAALEEPSDALTVEITPPPEEIVDRIVAQLPE